MTELFAPPPTYPESVLLSIYNAYPRKTGRPAALKRINEALNRICQGEIDGSPRTQAEAIEFLRVKTEEARRQMGARIQKNIPHPATFYNGRRYLRPELTAIVAQPKRMQACIEILAEYPNIDRHALIDSTDVYLPALNAIDKALERMEKKLESQHTYCLAQNAARRLKSRTELYAMAVKQWPVEDLKYVPNPVKWYSESRFEQNEQSWQRQPTNDYVSERQQLGRVLDKLNQTSNGGNRPN
jgi:hypothetical protein